MRKTFHFCMSYFDSISRSFGFLFLLVTQLLVLPALMCVFQTTVNNYIDDIAAIALAGF